MSALSSVNAKGGTTLYPPWLQIAQVSWILLTVISVLAVIASTIIASGETLPSCIIGDTLCGPWHLGREDIAVAEQLGLPGSSLQLFYSFGFLIPKIAFLAIGGLIFIYRSNDWMALLLSMMLVLFLLEGITNLGPLQPLIGVMYMFVTLIFLILPFIFPNGRFVPRWIIWPLIPFFIAGLTFSLITMLSIPIGNQLYSILTLVVYGLWFFLAGYSIIYRYRRVSNPIERQQTKWVVAGILGTFIGFIPLFVITARFPSSEPSAERLAFFFLVAYPTTIITYLFMPTSIAFAITRYRLWEIDVIIRKTLVYALLTGALAMVYFGAVVIMQGVANSVTGRTQSTQLSIVLSTLLIAALFTPLRRRVQSFIDRRFYRRKYDAGQTLNHFAATVRDEMDMERLTLALLQVVEETMQPETMSVWLKPAGSSTSI